MIRPLTLVLSAGHAAPRTIARGLSRRPWVLAPPIVAVTFLLMALAMSLYIDIPIRDPEGTLLGKRLVLPFLFMCLFLAIDVVIRARRTWRTTQAPAMRTIAETFLRRWWWQRMALTMLCFSSFHVTYLSYRNLKSMLSLVDYRTHDQVLLDLDRWMSFGHEPAVLLHDLLGTTIAAHVLSVIYLAFIPLVPVSVAAALTFSRTMREGFTYVMATMYCWILGTISYYIIPTLGPYFSDKPQFDDLAVTGVTQLQNSLVSQRANLISDPVGMEWIQGIAGFASLHVGLVFMAWVFFKMYGHRVLAWATMAFLIPTIIATIYFGWHFILDDLAGLFIGWFAVVSARYTLYPHIMLRPAVSEVGEVEPTQASAAAAHARG